MTRHTGVRVLVACFIVAVAYALSAMSAFSQGSSDGVEEIDLAKMTLPLEAYGPAYGAFVTDVESLSFEPVMERDDREVNAYFATYYNADGEDFTAGVVGSAAGLFMSPADAESFLVDVMAEFELGSKLGGEFHSFDVPGIDGAMGGSGNLVVPELELTFQLVIAMFPMDSLVGQVAFIRFDDTNVEAEVVAAAVALRDRMKGVLAGTVTDFPAPLPPDVNCNGSLDAIDASLILQLGAGLVDSLPCDALGDANQDGRVDAIDASLILQFSAELIDTLPV